VAISYNQAANGGSYFDSSIITEHTWAYQITKDRLYASNATSEYLRPEIMQVPQDNLTCTNFGPFDQIHMIGDGRVDVIVRAYKQDPTTTETALKEMDYLPNVECTPPPSSGVHQ
jgi:hypothetical protein